MALVAKGSQIIIVVIVVRIVVQIHKAAFHPGFYRMKSTPTTEGFYDTALNEASDV